MTKQNRFNEIYKLSTMLTDANIVHDLKPLYDGFQIIVYKNDENRTQLDDAVLHSGSHGYEKGLLETFYLNECVGYETAEEVFKGWQKMLTLE